MASKPSKKARSRRGAKRDAVPAVLAPTAYSARTQFVPPRSKLSTRRLQNRELVATINGSVAFAATTYAINPGVALSFPWLTNIANNFQQYRFHRLRYVFVTRVGTGVAGNVILSPEYNPNNRVPQSETEAVNTQDATEDVVWRENACTLDVGAMFPIGPRKQVRAQALPGDLQAYDAGKLTVGTVGMADASSVGKLWVEYDVELFVPESSPNTHVNTSASVYIKNSGQVVSTGAQTAITWTTAQDGLGLGNFNGSGVLTLPLGFYRISGVLNITDNANEAFLAQLTITNSAAVIAGFDERRAATGTNQMVVMAFDSGFASTGTNTLQLISLLTGAAGVLSVAQYSILWIELV
jgi:hypothetical protein